MKFRQYAGIFFICIGLALIFSACGVSASEETSALSIANNSVPALALVTDVPVTDQYAEEVITPTSPAPDECLLCHLDKQHLIDTAEPEVVVESESEGEG